MIILDKFVPESHKFMYCLSVDEDPRCSVTYSAVQPFTKAQKRGFRKVFRALLNDGKFTKLRSFAANIK